MSGPTSYEDLYQVQTWWVDYNLCYQMPTGAYVSRAYYDKALGLLKLAREDNATQAKLLNQLISGEPECQCPEAHVRDCPVVR